MYVCSLHFLLCDISRTVAHSGVVLVTVRSDGQRGEIDLSAVSAYCSLTMTLQWPFSLGWTRLVWLTVNVKIQLIHGNILLFLSCYRLIIWHSFYANLWIGRQWFSSNSVFCFQKLCDYTPPASPPFDNILSYGIVWGLRGNIIIAVLYCQHATSSMDTVNKNSSCSPVGPWVCLCVF